MAVDSFMFAADGGHTRLNKLIIRGDNARILFQKRNEHKTASVFLDRDGVFIEDVHFIKSPKDVKLCPGVKRLLTKLEELKVAVVMATNQSGIGRKYCIWDDYIAVTP